ncbi:Isy1p [Sporobolomyces salmoneus]|uniref:Isy1p n=1 Tax=Sporobolomyces salmoneus TaxID=183962 RepID=UPI00316EA060
MLGFHHFGTFLLFAAFVLLLVSCLTSPLFGPDRDFAIAKARVAASISATSSISVPVTSDIKFGVFGYCYNIANGQDQCSPTQLGYTIPPIINEIATITGNGVDQSTQDTIRSVTKAFVVHPIATGIAFLAFLIAACSDRIGFLCASLFTLFSFIVTVVCVVLDIVFFYVVRRYVENNYDVNVDINYSAGTWVTVAALCLARNEEKAQSMLYRFREAQAAELGLAQKTDRRPRVAASCKDLRQCERWRGEILREVSRKVSKIQDAGLTDYEIRDLNDQINKLLREKWHWENQIIALGGANYKRAAGKSTDADGREVPGQRGYKYFGRAKELPGVRELFSTSAANEAELESYKTIKISLFDNAAPEYYGDQAEQGESGKKLLEDELEAEKTAWEEAVENLEGEFEQLPSIPLPTRSIINLSSTSSTDTPMTTTEEEPEAVNQDGKRKASSAKSSTKKTKLSDGSAVASSSSNGQAQGFESIFEPELLKQPKLLTMEEMEKALVGRQKQMLLEEYGA